MIIENYMSYDILRSLVFLLVILLFFVVFLFFLDGKNLFWFLYPRPKIGEIYIPDYYKIDLLFNSNAGIRYKIIDIKKNYCLLEIATENNLIPKYTRIIHISVLLSNYIKIS